MTIHITPPMDPLMPTDGVQDVAGDVSPTVSGIFSLGETSKRWDNLYINQVVSEDIRSYHEPIASPATLDKGPAQADPITINTTVALLFALDTDLAHRSFKVPTNYANNAAVHVHWTKNVDSDQSGNGVNWQVTYVAYNGYSDDITVSGTVISQEDTYDDSGTTSRVVYRTANMPLTGLTPGNYVSLKLEALSPAGSALSGAAALITLDLTFDQYIHS